MVYGQKMLTIDFGGGYDSQLGRVTNYYLFDPFFFFFWFL